MTERRDADDETRVWQASEIEEALRSPRRTRKQRPPARRGSRGWQVCWRLVLWAFALGLGWYAGTRYFG